MVKFMVTFTDIRCRALYILPYPRFFSQHHGVGGHVAHAYGCIQGFNRLGFSLDIVAEEFHEIFNGEQNTVAVLGLGSSSLLKRQWWGRLLTQEIGQRVREKEFSFCYTRYSAGFAFWIPTLKRSLGRVSFVLEVNSLGSQHWVFMKSLDRRALRAADIIVCISQSLKEFIVSKLDAQLSPKILVIPNGVDVSRFQYGNGHKGDESRVRFGYAGLLKSNYGLEILISAFDRAFKENQQLILDIYGEGPFRPKLEELASSNPAVRFHGGVPFLAMPEILTSLDVLVYTTSEKNKFQSPTKMFEYMAAKKPIISARTPQLEEVLDEESALFFEIGDEVQLAENMLRLADDAALRQRLAARAHAEVLQHHTWDKRLAVLIDKLSGMAKGAAEAR